MVSSSGAVVVACGEHAPLTGGSAGGGSSKAMGCSPLLIPVRRHVLAPDDQYDQEDECRDGDTHCNDDHIRPDVRSNRAIVHRSEESFKPRIADFYSPNSALTRTFSFLPPMKGVQTLSAPIRGAEGLPTVQPSRLTAAGADDAVRERVAAMHVEVEVVELQTHPVTARIRPDRQQLPGSIGYDVVLMGWNDGHGLSPDCDRCKYQCSGHDRKGQGKLDLHSPSSVDCGAPSHVHKTKATGRLELSGSVPMSSDEELHALAPEPSEEPRRRTTLTTRVHAELRALRSRANARTALPDCEAHAGEELLRLAESPRHELLVPVCAMTPNVGATAGRAMAVVLARVHAVPGAPRPAVVTASIVKTPAVACDSR